nr:hypothetical protein Iba_chr12cCG14440 [Ipomoea batatas]
MRLARWRRLLDRRRTRTYYSAVHRKRNAQEARRRRWHQVQRYPAILCKKLSSWPI